MSIKVAINGYGRIGRNILRALYEQHRENEIAIVAINDMADVNLSAHLTRYDSVHGKFPGEVSVAGEDLVINNHKIRIYKERDPAKLPWKELGVDIVYECTGLFTDRSKAALHLQAGAKKILISAPSKDADATIVYGVNHQTLSANHNVVSNGSCTTNCLAPLVKPLQEKLGIVNGLMNTVHAYTNDQSLQDTVHSDIRRARAATQSIIPTKTGAASAIGLVIPELNGKLDGFAMRVPVINVSVVDLTFTAKRTTSVEEVNQILKDAAVSAALKGILIYNEEPLVSVDFNHNPASSIFDATLTKVQDTLVKVTSWYDNEWGFSNRMLDTSLAMMKV